MGIIESEADAIAWAHQMAKTPTTGDHEVAEPHPYCLGDDPCCCVQLIAACETARADERDKAAERVRVETLREARGWNAGLSDPAVREQIIKTLMDEGSESEGGWHSWRCHDKSRYPGPCGCTPAIVDALLAALRKPEVEG